MKTKESQEIRTDDVLGDGFVVDSVYMAIGGIPRGPKAWRTFTPKAHAENPSLEYNGIGRFGRLK